MGVNVTYQRSALADFLERLPSLLMEYKKTQWSMEQEAKLRKEDREYKAAVSMYSDAKELYKSAERSLDELENSWLQTGLGLDGLNEMFKTKGLDIVEKVYEGEATNWIGRANHYQDLAAQLGKKAQVMQNVLYDDIAKTKQIMAGGGVSGAGGGSDPVRWDMGDFGAKAYEETYGEPMSAISQEYLAANPGVVRQSLEKFESTRLLNRLRDAKNVNQDRRQSEQFLGGYVNSAYTKSGLSTVYEMEKIQNAYAKGAEEVDVAMNDQAVQKQRAGQVIIGSEFADLLGIPQAEAQEQIMDYYYLYDRMHAAAEQPVLTGGGEQGLRDFSLLVTNARQAYNHYLSLKNKGNNAEANRIEELAKKYFGFEGMGFQQYLTSLNMHFSKYALTNFEETKQVIRNDQSIFDDDIYEQEVGDEPQN